MYRYQCEACGALFESKAKADQYLCRNNGCVGIARRIQGVYTHPCES